jgi:hypothetical protein
MSLVKGLNSIWMILFLLTLIFYIFAVMGYLQSPNPSVASPNICPLEINYIRVSVMNQMCPLEIMFSRCASNPSVANPNMSVMQ